MKLIPVREDDPQICVVTGKVVWLLVEGVKGGAIRGVVVDSAVLDGEDETTLITVTLRLP